MTPLSMTINSSRPMPTVVRVKMANIVAEVAASQIHFALMR
jgi:hypothetical protein